MFQDKIEQIYGELPSTWNITNIAGLVATRRAELQTGPFGTMLHASAYKDVGTPVVAVQHIGENRLKHVDLPRIDEFTKQRLMRYELRIGDIVFGRKGAVDRRALITHEEQGWLQGSDCIRLRILDSSIDPVFISYVLGSTAYRRWITQNAHGATMPSLNQEILGRVPLPIPTLPEQRAIAAVLGALDDKIELNRRVNQTLEQMAQALFKSWFVDFDPIHANRNGEAMPGLAKEVQALFPSAFEDSALGEIPQGWRIGQIGDHVQVVGGSTPSTKDAEFWDSGVIHWATPKDLSDLHDPVLIQTERKITEAGLAQISSGLLPEGTVLLSSRAPIGYIAVAEIPVAINQGFIAMKCDGGLPNHYVRHWARVNKDVIIGRANGTTFLEISKTNFRPIPVIVPQQAIIILFQTQAQFIHNKVVANLKQSDTLAATRDALLPRLLSGEVRVREAEKMIEEML